MCRRDLHLHITSSHTAAMSNNTGTVSFSDGPATATFLAEDVGMFFAVGVGAVVVGVLAYWGVMKIYWNNYVLFTSARLFHY